MSDNKYWQHFGELADEERTRELAKDEFNEILPFEDASGKGWLDAKAPRRDFLKYLGFSTAAASLAASCEVPVRKAIPYAVKPDNIEPGIAKYYATTYVQDGDVIPVVAKVRDGRPIKIEGNTLSTITGGGTSAQAQASVLDLYDTARLRHPKRRVNNKLQEVPNFDQLDKIVMDALAASAGQVVLLTSTLVSPSTKDIISRYPGLRHVQYDSVSYSGMLLANEITSGSRNIPSYHFENADVIVSLGADFLGTWLSPVEFGRQYATGRKLDENNPKMSKHYQFESYLSATGSNADERFTHKPSQTGQVALALLAGVGGAVTAPTLADQKLVQGINKVVNDLKSHQGRALVVSGSNDVNVQVIVNAINSAIGAYGTTIDAGTPVNYRQGIDKDMADLIAQMEGGQVGALLIYGANPVYDYYDGVRFANALKKMRISVSFNEKLDETTELCQYVIPHHHYLESWGDAEAKSGHYSFLQPTIFPLFKTRYFQTSLLKWSGNNTDYETYFRQYWQGRLGEKAFEAALRDGVVEPGGSVRVSATPVTDTTSATTGTTPVTPSFSSGGFNGGGVTAAAQAIGNIRSDADEIILYQKVSIGTGKQAGNPWLQELPDPVSKATWDNYAMISLVKAKEWFGLDFTDPHNSKKITNYQYFPDKPVISIKVNNKELRLPVLVIPGMNANTIAVAVGYGRSEGFGKASAGVGQNAYPFATFNGTTVNYYNTSATVEKTGDKYKLALMQVQNSYEDRTEVVKETTLATFKKYPTAYKKERDELAHDYARKTGNYRAEATLYPDPDSPERSSEIKWGMVVDMNTCVGCQACVVACHAENNVPVVGKKQVMRYHDMHWLRIDRYFVTSENNPDDLKTVVFQPMLCQHCDNAPCENVCPVAATPHSAEGINMMAYNRCVGTRYCANNCPYKVRRFNWADYTGADSFGDNQSHLGDVVAQMNDDLTRMVLNPDVTVRSRGVMEKCSFCIQRTQEAKLTAKKENRLLVDGDVKTACMQACPTGAIVFGNVKDPQSQVSKLRATKQNTSFYVIDQLHTLPNITYLARIRNTDEIIDMEHGAGEHAKDEEGVGTQKPEGAETH